MKNKKRTVQFLVIGFFLVSIFLGVSVFSDTVFAQQGFGEASGSNAAAVAGIENGDSIPDGDNYVVTAFKYLLYWLLIILVQFVQVGASIFAWATRPEYISGSTGLLNLASVYTLWGFVRDFFNLFFIFLLLFSAFATVFQIEQYGIKKNFFKIIIAAIVINFSFPFTRIIIDLGNVPMYFFADGLVSAGATKENTLLAIPNALFSSTGMGSIVTLPQPSQDGTLVPLITAIIFTFIFMITLVTLAFLFVLRLLKLVILLILSPVGVAAAIVPGLSKYGSQWMSELLKTVFWGPAAMFMIVVALRFSAEIQNSGFAQGLAGTAPAASPDSQSSVIAQGVFFIPVIMMWMAMGIAKKSGIEGAGFVTKQADKAVAWGKKASLGVGRVAASPVSTRAKGYKSGIKDRFDNTVIGGKYWKEKGEVAEARAKARAKGILTSKGMGAELSKADAQLRDKKAREQEKKWKDDGAAPSDILKDLKDKKNYETDKAGNLKRNEKGQLIPKAKALAAARALSTEKEFINDAGELRQALEVASATGNRDLYSKLLENAGDNALEFKSDDLNQLVNQELASRIPKDASEDDIVKVRKTIQGSFKSRMKKGGKISNFVDYKVGELKSQKPTLSPADLRREVYKSENIFNLNAKDIAKNKKLLGEVVFQEEARAKWNKKQVNSVEKFLIDDEGDEEAIKVVESIRKTVEAREKKKEA